MSEMTDFSMTRHDRFYDKLEEINEFCNKIGYAQEVKFVPLWMWRRMPKVYINVERINSRVTMLPKTRERLMLEISNKVNECAAGV